MASSSQILREYLVSLGYKINTASEKKFDLSLNRTYKTVLGIAVGVQALAAVWARSMEQLYYSSIKADTSAKRLQSLASGAARVGVSGEQMTSAIEGMARAVRLNPGLNGFIKSLGVKTQGRQMGDVMLDVLDKARKMPFFQGAGMMQAMFGMDPDTYLLLSQGLDKLKEAAKVREEIAKAAGLDADEAARAGMEYSNQIRDITDLVSVLKDTTMIALLPAFQEVAGVVKELLKDWTQIIKTGEIWLRIKEGLSLLGGGAGAKPGVELSADTKRRTNWTMGRSAGGPVTESGAAPETKEKTGEDSKTLFARLEKQYGLPSGMLDSIWERESSRGKNMLSPAGAKGHFGFMPKTADEFGIAGKEDDLEASADASARKMKGLLAMYKGDKRLAAAAYNWGQGNLAGVGNDISKAPGETRNYADAIGGKAITVNSATTIHVASDNPETAGKQVAREQMRVGADLTRNIGGLVVQ